MLATTKVIFTRFVPFHEWTATTFSVESIINQPISGAFQRPSLLFRFSSRRRRTTTTTTTKPHTKPATMCADKLIVLLHLLLTIQCTWCGRINVPLDQSNCQHVSGGGGETCAESGPRPIGAAADRATSSADANVARLPTSATDTLRGTSVSSHFDHKLPVRDRQIEK